MLDDLQPAPKIDAPKDWRPALEFDGTNTSRWQVARPFPLEPQWLSSWRFHFRKRIGSVPDLPTLYASAKKTKKPATKQTESNKVFVVCLADFQVGKSDHRGGKQELIARILESYDRIEAQLKAGKYSHIYALDLGDIIEGIDNAANMTQLQTNDLSVMQQVDLAAALIWDFLKMATKYAPVTYASIGSNHCQWRVNRQQIGKPGVDDWGIVILQQVRRLAVEVGLPVSFLIPSAWASVLEARECSYLVEAKHFRQSNWNCGRLSPFDGTFSSSQDCRGWPVAQRRFTLLGASIYQRQRLRLVQAHLGRGFCTGHHLPRID